MKVLLLVDIQNDFCPGGAMAVPEGDQVVEIANRLMASGEYDYVIASLDWRTVDSVAFAENHPGKEVSDEIFLNYGEEKVKQTLKPRHCVVGTKGAEFHPDLDVERINASVCKGTNPRIDSHSAFYDKAQLQQTGLLEILGAEAMGRGERLPNVELSICGLPTDDGVAATARDARALGIETKLVVDGCRANNIEPYDELKTLRDLKDRGVSLITSREIVPEVPLREMPYLRATRTRDMEVAI